MNSMDPPQIDRFSSMDVPVSEVIDINEEMDSDEEEICENKLPLAPEIHEESARFSNEYPKLKISFSPLWKWLSKPLNLSPSNTKLKMLLVTWNMFGKTPPKDLSQILPPNCKHHIYALTTQECLRSISSNLIYSSKRNWENQVEEHLGPDYKIIASGTNGATHLIIFIHECYSGLVSQVRTKTITNGVGNIIANKGAVSISFCLGSTSVLFVGCHLASGQNSVSQRNNDFRRIEKEVSKTTKTSESADFCFFFGDMNYRINGNKEDVEILVQHKMFDPLLKGDQLKIEMAENTLFLKFVEGPINFPPTYRFNHGTSSYDTSKKQRVPAWTDRIIYKFKEGGLHQKSYGCISSCESSDHKPVFSQFSLRFNPEKSTVVSSQKSRACVIC